METKVRCEMDLSDQGILVKWGDVRYGGGQRVWFRRTPFLGIERRLERGCLLVLFVLCF